MPTLTEVDTARFTRTIMAHARWLSSWVRAFKVGTHPDPEDAMRQIANELSEAAKIITDLTAQIARKDQALKKAQKRFKEIKSFAKGDLALADFEESAKLGLNDLRRASLAMEGR